MASRVPALVTTQWLKSQLPKAKNLCVLDASWSPKEDSLGYSMFKEEHIPHSKHYDLNKCVQYLPTLPRNLPDEKCLEGYAQSLGINKETHLIVYDRGSMILSSRLWWTFRAFGHENISVLEGGYKRWVASAYPVVKGEQTPTKQQGTFEVKRNSNIIADFEEMVEIARSKKCQIVDVRNVPHFRGEESEPTKATINILKGANQNVPETMLRGHIPGAKNIPENDLINTNTNCFHDKQHLERLLHSAGIQLNKPMVTMCYNGHAACLLALVSATLGKMDTKVYYGSWTDYAQRAPEDLCVRGDTTPAAG